MTETAELLPPDPTVSGYHLIGTPDGNETAWRWLSSLRVWRDIMWADCVPEVAARKSYRYLCPIPPAARLAAMGDIVTYFGLALAEHELINGEVPDETVIWTGYEHYITAGMIRRATGEAP